MNQRVLFAMVGHTAAGKTTLSKYLTEETEFDIFYIEEGQIKRDIVGAYTTNDSLNEELRDQAYEVAIQRAGKRINDKDVLIDASFHRLERRRLIYSMLLAKQECPAVILLYCYCPDLNKVETRIERRKKAVKTAETQADSMKIYNHIIKNFCVPDISEIPKELNGAIIYINTDSNEIEQIKYNTECAEMRSVTEQVCENIKRKQACWKELE